MTAKINHLAIVSERYAISGKFYEAVFGMKSVAQLSPTNAIVVGDGYLGLNINPRYVARPARLDHFGIEVDDVEAVFERFRRDYPRIEWLKRPSNRPFAGITTHDPDGNVFDLSQKRMANRTDIYEQAGWQQNRHVSSIAVRTLNPDAMADFYAGVFGFTARNGRDGDPNRYVSDGRITLALMPWHITDFAGTGIVSPSLDHVGFTVESIAALEADVERVIGENPLLAPLPVGKGPEGKARLDLARRGGPENAHWLADPDGVLIAVAEAA
jgi:catechol 2,3-dioxygenase-like lactoylglutathione lyase family enzyme